MGIKRIVRVHNDTTRHQDTVTITAVKDAGPAQYGSGDGQTIIRDNIPG
jgi:hypothetical protein